MRPNTLKLVKIGIFSAIATVISMIIRIPVFFAPGFYRLDFSDTVVLISAFSLGPAAGVLTESVKILLKVLIKGSPSLGIAELAKFTTGLALVLPAAIIYKKNRTLKSACIALTIGVFCTLLVSAIMNFFVLLPVFGALFNVSEQKIIAAAQAIIPFVTDKCTFVLFVVCPFNFIESTLVCVFALLLYKRLAKVFSR